MQFGRHEDKEYVWVYGNDIQYGQYCVNSSTATAASFRQNAHFDRWLAWFKEADRLRAPLSYEQHLSALHFREAELARREREKQERAAAERRAVQELKALRASTANAQLCLLGQDMLMYILKCTNDIPSILQIACACKELRKIAGSLHWGLARPRMDLLTDIVFQELASHQSEIKGGWVQRREPLADKNIIGNGGNGPHPPPWWRNFQILSSLALVDGQFTQLAVVRGTAENFRKLMKRSWICKHTFLEDKHAALKHLRKIRRLGPEIAVMVTHLRLTGRLVRQTDHPGSNDPLLDMVEEMRALRKLIRMHMNNMEDLNEEHNLHLKMPPYKYDLQKGEDALMLFLEDPLKRGQR